MKPYAVVKFPTENLVGIVCSKWISPDGKDCVYPASKSDLFNMTLILKKNKDAMPGWDRHPIVILGQYATYAEAKECESRAEDTSNLSSEEEGGAPKRIRRPTKKYDDTDDEDSISPPTKMSKLCPKPPSLAKFSFNEQTSTQFRTSETDSISPPAKMSKLCLKPPSLATFSFNEQTCTQPRTSETDPTALITSEYHSSKNNSTAKSLSCTPPQNEDSYTSSSSSCQNEFSISRRFSTPQSVQRNPADYLQVMGKLNHLILIVSALKQRIEDLDKRIQDMGQTGVDKTDKNEDVLKCLPIEDMEMFDSFEQKLEEENFRKSFVKSMASLGGRDPNTMMISILKCVLMDKTAELFSLTGKKMGNFATKRKFMDTRTCLAIIDAVRRRFKEVTNDTLKNTIKHWLQQATPRIQKRSKREDKANQEIGES